MRLPVSPPGRLQSLAERDLDILGTLLGIIELFPHVVDVPRRRTPHGRRDVTKSGAAVTNRRGGDTRSQSVMAKAIEWR